MGPAATFAKTRCYVVDALPIARKALVYAIGRERDLTVVGHAADAIEALQEVPRLAPDVVLVDVDLPDETGFDLLDALRARMPATRLLSLSEDAGDDMVAAVRRAGATLHLRKGASLGEILDAVRHVARSAPIAAA